MKKIITFITILMLVVMMIPTSAFATTSVVDTWDGSIDTAWYDANPTSTSFQINTAEELAGLAKIVNEGTDDFEVNVIVLMNHLDLKGKAWTAIGNSPNAFKGIFDGNHYTISNLTASGVSYMGLFGRVSGNGIIGNLGLKNVNITSTGAHDAVGALVGSATQDAIIERCYVIGGKITSTAQNTGGLVGSATNLISDCYADIDVSGGSRTGGLVGGCQLLTVSKSFATGNVSGTDYVGGLVGGAYHGITIEYSYATGTVTTSGANAGSLFAGRDPLYTTGSIRITKSYGNNANTIKGEGVNGSSYILGTYGASLQQMKTPAFQEALNLGDSKFPFGTDASFNGGYPYLTTIPQIMTGDKQVLKKGENTDLVIKITPAFMDASMSFAMVTEVNGVAVPSEMVSYKEGSIIMTLSGDYTSTLPAGTYSIAIGSGDIGMARGTFSVVDDSVITDTEDEETSPKTGDSSSALGMLLVMGVSALGLVSLKKRSRA